MYCRNCGTVVPGYEELCEACRMEMIIHRQKEPQLDMSREKRGVAIASIIVGVVGYLVPFIVLFGVLAGMSNSYTYRRGLPEGMGVVAILMSILAIGCQIFGIIGGAQGIAAFRRAGRMNARRPIASLICGIIGLADACIFLLYWVIVIFAVGATVFALSI